MSKLKKFKYEKYNYDFLLPLINLGDFYKDGVIESVNYDAEQDVIHIIYRTSIDRITINMNVTDLIENTNG
jgi:hypothetical protein